MIDLDAKIRSLVECNIPRKDIVSELDAIASDAESRAKPSKGTRHRGAANAASAFRDSMSVPQLIFLPRAVIAGNAAIFSPRWTMKAS